MSGQRPDERPFAEPWQAEAFALAVELNRRGLFTWSEWAEALGRAIDAAPADDGSHYYEHWLAALESLVIAKGAASVADIGRLTEAWLAAAAATPHGEPIRLAEEAMHRVAASGLSLPPLAAGTGRGGG